ncbi:twin transmembrane helix small protein [Ahrensia marina]|uniref:twin transmembrane helix small protein n=1 Tax=Ahrensia marina TaxID=1514904 RepID=UPI0035D07448
MSTFLQILSFLALASVAVVLFLGLANLMRGGSSNRSQQLMRWRVILQAIAIVVVMIVAWFASQS